MPSSPFSLPPKKRLAIMTQRAKNSETDLNIKLFLFKRPSPFKHNSTQNKFGWNYTFAVKLTIGFQNQCKIYPLKFLIRQRNRQLHSR